MLVLSRKTNEVIVIGDNIRIMVVAVNGDKVRLGIEAPREVPVHRLEVFEAIARGGAQGREIATEVTEDTEAEAEGETKP